MWGKEIPHKWTDLWTDLLLNNCKCKKQDKIGEVKKLHFWRAVFHFFSVHEISKIAWRCYTSYKRDCFKLQRIAKQESNSLNLAVNLTFFRLHCACYINRIFHDSSWSAVVIPLLGIAVNIHSGTWNNNIAHIFYVSYARSLFKICMAIFLYCQSWIL